MDDTSIYSGVLKKKYDNQILHKNILSSLGIYSSTYHCKLILFIIRVKIGRRAGTTVTNEKLGLNGIGTGSSI